MKITYTVFKYGRTKSGKRRPYYVVRWKHGPVGREKGERSTRETTSRKAEEWASRFIATLESEAGAMTTVTWKAFRQAYEDRRLANIRSAASYRSALNAAEKYLPLRRIDDLTADAVATLKRKLIKSGSKPATAASYAKHLRAALGWAESQGMILKAPSIKTGSTDSMRGRPITVEEFERMQKKLPELVSKKYLHNMQRVLIGAWSIGLRRAEFFRVHWDRDDRIHPLGLNAGTPRIFFPADQHKAGRDLLVPLLPEAAEMFRQTPRSQRHGPVFLPLGGKRKIVKNPDGLGRLIGELGRLAGVVTRTDPDTGQKAHATLHDLRRSLGTRLAHASSLSVPEVARVMRHRKIETTLAHYADLDISTLGEKLFSELGCTSSCTPISDDKKTVRVSR